jgi:LacI family repressor for deo operon, udp, cdd, tsx, nupC, and nupG
MSDVARQPAIDDVAGHRLGGPAATIALVVPNLTDPAAFDVIRGVGAAAAAAGCTMLLAGEPTSVDPATADGLLPAADGLVLAGPLPPDETVQALAARRPVVTVGRIVPGVAGVVPDIAAATGHALDHLRNLGHRSITYLTGPALSWVDGQRQRMLPGLAEQRGIELDRIGPLPPTAAGGRAAAEEVLRRTSTAVLAGDDLLAIGLIRALAEIGVPVPDALSVIGFGDAYYADFCVPPLTTIAAPLHAMGAEAFRELHRQLGGEPRPRRFATALPARLVVRHSTAAPHDRPGMARNRPRRSG